jgi:hypothetical protein
MMFNSKNQVQPKMCEFKLVGSTKGKAKSITSKKFDFSTRLNSSNSNLYIDIGKGIELLVNFNFLLADNKKHADLIKRDTQNVKEDEDDDNST